MSTSNQSRCSSANRCTSRPRLLLWAACALAAVGIAQAQTATETVLHNFKPNPPKGANPAAGLVGDSNGNLYGATPYGGAMNAGVVFQIDSAGHYKAIYTFTGGADGCEPNGVILDPAGNLYGTTSYGGDAAEPCDNGPAQGVVFKIDTTGHETVLYTFSNGEGYSMSGVVRDPAGNLYGTATSQNGFVYKLDTAGKLSALYTFTGGADGGGPEAGVILDSAGNLYGTTAAGGAAGDGVVYMLDASRRYREKVLYSFKGGADGREPLAGVVRDAAGNLYGTTAAGGTAGPGRFRAGVVYKLDPSGQETVLYSFTGGSDGCYPNAVVLDSAGNLY